LSDCKTVDYTLPFGVKNICGIVSALRRLFQILKLSLRCGDNFRYSNCLHTV